MCPKIDGERVSLYKLQHSTQPADEYWKMFANNVAVDGAAGHASAIGHGFWPSL